MHGKTEMDRSRATKVGLIDALATSARFHGSGCGGRLKVSRPELTVRCVVGRQRQDLDAGHVIFLPSHGRRRPDSNDAVACGMTVPPVVAIGVSYVGVAQRPLLPVTLCIVTAPGKCQRMPA